MRTKFLFLISILVLTTVFFSLGCKSAPESDKMR